MCESHLQTLPEKLGMAKLMTQTCTHKVMFGELCLGNFAEAAGLTCNALSLTYTS